MPISVNLSFHRWPLHRESLEELPSISLDYRVFLQKRFSTLKLRDRLLAPWNLVKIFLLIGWAIWKAIYHHLIVLSLLSFNKILLLKNNKALRTIALLFQKIQLLHFKVDVIYTLTNQILSSTKLHHNTRWVTGSRLHTSVIKGNYISARTLYFHFKTNQSRHFLPAWEYNLDCLVFQTVTHNVVLTFIQRYFDIVDISWTLLWCFVPIRFLLLFSILQFSFSVRLSHSLSLFY